MTNEEMGRLIDEHFEMEGRGDIDGILNTLVDEGLDHDIIGYPPGPQHDKARVREFYETLHSELPAVGVTPLRRYYGEDFAVDEVIWEGRADGRPFGIEGRGRPVKFRLLHVFEFRDGKISRENVWMDFATFYAQLGALPVAATA